MGSAISPLNSISPGSLDGGYSNISSGAHTDLATAAQQFEALMLHQMLQAAHDPDESWFGTGEDDDQASKQAMDLAQQQFASALAAHGGLGLAKLVVSQMGENPVSPSEPAAGKQ
jgi:Rod binding domain-containing protein